jgi:hypothetical protein
VQPPGGLCMLARGTRPMFAGMRALLQFLALRALGDVAAQGRSPALFNSLQGCQVAGGHAVTATGAIRGSMALEDLGHLDHHRSRKARRGLPCAW